MCTLGQSKKGSFNYVRTILFMSAMSFMMWNLLSMMAPIQVANVDDYDPMANVPSKWVYSENVMESIHDLHSYVNQLAIHDAHLGTSVFASAAFANGTGDFAPFLNLPQHALDHETFLHLFIEKPTVSVFSAFLVTPGRQCNSRPTLRSPQMQKIPEIIVFQ